jgi:hypothetical protein
MRHRSRTAIGPQDDGLTAPRCFCRSTGEPENRRLVISPANAFRLLLTVKAIELEPVPEGLDTGVVRPAKAGTVEDRPGFPHPAKRHKAVDHLGQRFDPFRP